MHYKLEKLFHTLEASRKQLLAAVQTYPKNITTHKPSPAEWSMAQVVIHLAITEAQILGYVQKRLLKGGLQNSNFRSWLRYVMIVTALRFRKKIKAPQQVKGPPEQITLEEAMQTWEQGRQQWQQFLLRYPADVLGKNIFKHPLAGYLNLSQTLDFMNEHVRHHISQIHRIGKAVHTTKNAKD